MRLLIIVTFLAVASAVSEIELSEPAPSVIQEVDQASPSSEATAITGSNSAATVQAVKVTSLGTVKEDKTFNITTLVDPVVTDDDYLKYLAPVKAAKNIVTSTKTIPVNPMKVVDFSKLPTAFKDIKNPVDTTGSNSFEPVKVFDGSSLTVKDEAIYENVSPTVSISAEPVRVVDRSTVRTQVETINDRENPIASTSTSAKNIIEDPTATVPIESEERVNGATVPVLIETVDNAATLSVTNTIYEFVKSEKHSTIPSITEATKDSKNPTVITSPEAGPIEYERVGIQFDPLNIATDETTRDTQVPTAISLPEAVRFTTLGKVAAPAVPTAYGPIKDKKYPAILSNFQTTKDSQVLAGSSFPGAVEPVDGATIPVPVEYERIRSHNGSIIVAKETNVPAVVTLSEDVQLVDGPTVPAPAEAVDNAAPPSTTTYKKNVTIPSVAEASKHSQDQIVVTSPEAVKLVDGPTIRIPVAVPTVPTSLEFPTSVKNPTTKTTSNTEPIVINSPEPVKVVDVGSTKIIIPIKLIEDLPAPTKLEHAKGMKHLTIPTSVEAEPLQFAAIPLIDPKIHIKSSETETPSSFVVKVVDLPPVPKTDYVQKIIPTFALPDISPAIVSPEVMRQVAMMGTSNSEPINVVHPFAFYNSEPLQNFESENFADSPMIELDAQMDPVVVVDSEDEQVAGFVTIPEPVKVVSGELLTNQVKIIPLSFHPFIPEIRTERIPLFQDSQDIIRDQPERIYHPLPLEPRSESAGKHRDSDSEHVKDQVVDSLDGFREVPLEYRKQYIPERFGDETRSFFSKGSMNMDSYSDVNDVLLEDLTEDPVDILEGFHPMPDEYRRQPMPQHFQDVPREFLRRDPPPVHVPSDPLFPPYPFRIYQNPILR